MKLILLLVLGITVSDQVATADVLLKNGDFSKANTKGRPLDWSIARFISDVTVTNKQLNVKINSVQKMQGYIAQTVKLRPGHIYRLTGEVQCSQPGVAFLQVKVRQKRYNAAVPGTKWQTASINFSTGSSDKATILCRMTFSKKNQGTVCSFRKLSLIDAGLSGRTSPGSVENLLPNSSFEMGREARQIYAFTGDYRRNTTAKWQIVRDCAYDGKQSLLMSGKSAYTWNVLYSRSSECVFSVYLKSDGNARVELGLEPVYLHTQGGIKLETVKKSFNVSKQWKRYEISFKLKKKLSGYSSRQLYRVWIKPLSDQKVWADAAQLEPGLTTSAYSPVSAGSKQPFAYNEKVEGPASTPQWRNKQSRTGIVRLSVANPGTKSFQQFPVSTGIPFPPGELFDPDAVKLKDCSGRNVPVQSAALARRHRDGSIISLLVNFQADAGNAYSLHYGGKIVKKEHPADLVCLRNDKYIIDTGAVQAVIDRKNFRGFSRISNKQNHQVIEGPDSGCFIITPDNKIYSSFHSRGNVVIERNGPLHAVIRADGVHRSTDGKELLHYIVRIHAYAGKPYFLVEITYENREKQYNTLIKAIGLELPLPETDKVVYQLTDGGSKAVSLGNKGVDLTQLHEEYGYGKYSIAINNGSRQTIDNSRANGVFQAGKSAVAIKDFWQRNPLAVSINRHKISVYLWPEREVKYADLPFGMASSISIAYAPFGNAPEANMLVNHTPLPQASPEWIAASKVFGNFLVPKEAKLKYPRYHRYLQAVFNRITHLPATMDFTGTINYGEFGGSTKRLNNESVINMSLWLQYVRSGESDIFNLAQAMTQHQREVDVCHAGEGACFMHTHCALINTSYMFHTGHFWITGLIWHYLLTGDMRSYNVARDLGANLLLKYRLSHYKGRERARMLLHLAELYELTHLECFRHAYETHYNFGQPSPTKGDYYIGIGLLCLKKWYDVTGEKKYLDRFIRDAREILELRKKSKYGKTSFDAPDYAVGSGRDWYLFQAMAEVAEVTGDRQYITTFYDWMVAYMIHPTGSSINAVQGSCFLKSAEKLGIKENPMTPRNLLGIAGMTGCYCSSLNMIIDPIGKNATVNIYRARPFRYWKSIKSKGEDTIKYKIVPPNALKNSFGTLSGPRPISDKEIVLPQTTKTYQLDLKFINDAWGAVSVSNGKVFLKADQYFAARTAPLTSRDFEFTAIPTDQLTVVLQWRKKNIISEEGKTFGIMLKAPDGTVIGSARWAVPVGSVFNMDGSPMRKTVDSLTILIPARYRAKPVKVFIAAPKATRWKFGKLKKPFLELLTQGK